jgi:hypothetical protein
MKKGSIIVLALSLIYLIFSWFSIGFRSDQVFLVAVVVVSYSLDGVWRRFLIAFSIFIVYWIIYDTMKLFPNYEFNPVNIEKLYLLEKQFFGIATVDGLITPNEYFLTHHSRFLDSLCALFYLSWIPLPLLFAFYLFRRNPVAFLRFSLAFFLANMIGFIIYYLHPAAPPWYVELNGFSLDTSTKSNAAGLLRFDDFTGLTFFRDMYAKGSNVFAAMPSLHAAYPFLGLYYSYVIRNKFFTVCFAIFTAGIWFSAVYLTHHYILDIIAGLLCAIAAIFLLDLVMMRNSLFRKWFKKYLEMITNGKTA